ncbi:PEPxxWA-CTERM sorting domain-containing protein [Sphingobium sufflavum]|uniref:PEPxxWA-CTERM sorting domain-containing protein n=1 Tax=Sphingobium sufflavum TaxID=1129547 RepID=UPI001F2BC69F|nr:PEPxxWA-CTERM sorting domain-containing protein [Sphingobium sufflavum]MCE7797828.1 PEPxxWA-CTERM sorting domain-containing protein [Sphingobium sufflavum]
MRWPAGPTWHPPPSIFRKQRSPPPSGQDHFAFSRLILSLTPYSSPFTKDGITISGSAIHAVSTHFWGSVDSILANQFNGFIEVDFAATSAIGFYVAGGYGSSPIGISLYNGATQIYSGTPIVGGVHDSFSFFGVDGIGSITRLRLDSAGVTDGFASLGPISFVSTGAVGEPATWAMMLFGFGAVGYAMRAVAKASRHYRSATPDPAADRIKAPTERSGGAFALHLSPMEWIAQHPFPHQIGHD